MYRAEYRKTDTETLFVQHTIIANTTSRPAQAKGRLSVVYVALDDDDCPTA